MSLALPSLRTLDAAWSLLCAALIHDGPGSAHDEPEGGDAPSARGPAAPRPVAAAAPSRSGGPPPVRRVPDRPGRWRLTRPDGSVTVLRVIDRNGQLYGVRGGLLAVAVPIAHFEGDWAPLG